jgi:hypothetical protein
MKLLATLLLAVSAWAQIAVGVAPYGEKNVKALLGNYANKHMTMWVVAARNDSPEKVSLYESAVLMLMSQYAPIPAKEANIWVQGSAKKSGWVITGGIVQESVLLTSFFATSGIMAIGRVWSISLAGFNSNAPHFVQLLAGQAIPAMDNFVKLAWFSPMDLDPGASGVTFIFTDKIKGTAHYNSFQIDKPAMPMRAIR